MLTIRQLLPVAGGSVIVEHDYRHFPALLAWGYQQGGAARQSGKSLSNNFLMVGWLIGLLYFYFILFLLHPKPFGQPSYPLIAFLLLIIAPLIFILGQTVPITMNMIKSNLSVGHIGGNTLGLSTLGSFLGAIITTLVFMYFFGVAWTLFIDFLLLTTLSLILTESSAAFIYKSLLAAAMTVLVFFINIAVEQHFFALTNHYANYQILDHHNAKLKNDEKILVINDTYSSFINAKNQGSPYIEVIKKIIFTDLKLTNADILVRVQADSL